MDNFRIIYKILKALERALDIENFDKNLITAEALGISEERWSRIMKMMIDEGYIEGVRNIKYDGATVPLIKMLNPAITLKGLEYLENNSMMKKAADIAKGIIDIVS